jgi:hypothetical protein
MIEAKDVLELVEDKWAIIPTVISKPQIVNESFATSLGDWVTTFRAITYADPYYGSEPVDDPDNGPITANPEGSGLDGAILVHDSVLGVDCLKCDGGTWDNIVYYYGAAKFTLPSSVAVEAITSIDIQLKAASLGVKLYYSDNTSTIQFLQSEMDYTDPCNPVRAWSTVQFDLTGITSKRIIAVAFWSSDPAEVRVESLVINITGELFLALDEYNPTHPKYQIVFVNKPQRNIYITTGVSKKEQVVTMELHVKTPYYKPTALDTFRETFLAIKDEVDRIMEEFRFDTLGSIINMSGWVDAKLPHGYSNTKEPLELVSKFTIEISYYVSIDGANIGNRVKSVNVLDQPLLGLINASWDDKDIWVELQVAKGPLLNQQLLGSQVYITIQTHDYPSLYTCFYATAITTGHYPINSDGSRTKFSASGDKFDIVLGDMDGVNQTFNFYDVRVVSINLEKASVSGLQETVWTIKLKARVVAYSAPA